jgi:acetolactate synthase-1/3 small subunit
MGRAGLYSAALVQRELLLAKVSILGPEVYEELMQHRSEMSAPTEESTFAENAEIRLQELEEQRSRESDQGSLMQRAREMLGQGAEYHPSRLSCQSGAET